ncbi:MAG TPA: hypothetical protein VLV86_04450 [Vicinamibacterales bacterium]|nr:hypothetical protein [Vicinamibacterales bacterium]
MGNRIADAVRYATECSNDARRISTMAQDAVQERLNEASRTLKVMQRRMQDAEHTARYYVRREPLKAIGVTAGAALTVGLAVGWLATRVFSAPGARRQTRFAWR